MPAAKEGATQDAAGVITKGSRFQAQDFAWVLFVAVLIATDPEINYNYTILVLLIGAFQIVQPRLKLFASRRGQVAAVIIKLILSYLLVGWTHGVGSYFYNVFLIPVVSAATVFELRGVILVTALACAGYFSYLLPVFTRNIELPPDYLSLMTLRASFYAIVGFLVYQQAKARREEIKRTQLAAERLTESNRHLREAQASLRRSERLAALGQLTAGLAHELRNPLGTIKASSEMLMKPATKARSAVMDEMAGNISSEVDRMNGLIASFLDFAKPLAIHPEQADLRPVLQEVAKEQADLARSRGVSIQVTADEPLVCSFDRDLLRLALSNLVQNAIQASAAGQRVTIAAANVENKLRISVEDEGEGIQPQHLENIFNPFFTTKPQGVGLGLALVSKIVDEHGGTIEVKSEPGKGTRFVVEI